MPKFSFNEAVERRAEGDMPKSSSGWITFAQGDNRVRLLSEPASYAEHYIEQGYKGVCVGTDDNCPGCLSEQKPAIKYLFWAIDRRDSQIKLCKITWGIYKQLGVLQADPEYAFDGMPMPYDVNIKVNKEASSPSGYYTVVPARTSVPLTNGETAELGKQTPIKEVAEKIKAKKVKELADKKEASVGVKVGSTDLPYPEEDSGHILF